MISPADRSARLRGLLAEGCVAMPGAINPLSARLIERAGFDAVYLSGAVLANSVGGVPDDGRMTLEDAAGHAERVARATSLPIVADADTGYGEAADSARAVETLEHAGVSGIHLEDQVFPKRCGHLEGKELVTAEAFCEKIAAAASAKSSADFLLIARTDARGVEGFDAAVRRANLYCAAGADAVFPEGLRSAEEFARFAREVDVPLLANMTEFGSTPYLRVDEFAAMGYSMVIFPVTLQRVAMKAMEEALDAILATGSQRILLEHMQTRDALYELLDYEGTVAAPVPTDDRKGES